MDTQKGYIDMIKMRKDKNEQLYRAILQLKDEQECYEFFQDLLERTGASSATISRVNRSLSYGTGGYTKIFERIKDEEK